MSRSRKDQDNPKGYRAQQAGRTNKKYQQLTSSCCGCHPDAHDSSGCMVCKICLTSYKEAMKNSSELAPAEPSTRNAYKRSRATPGEMARARAIEIESMPTVEEMKEEAQPCESERSYRSH